MTPCDDDYHLLRYGKGQQQQQTGRKSQRELARTLAASRPTRFHGNNLDLQELNEIDAKDNLFCTESCCRPRYPPQLCPFPPDKPIYGRKTGPKDLGQVSTPPPSRHRPRTDKK